VTLPRWHRVATIAGREFAWHLRRKSFLLTTFGLPVVGLIVGGVTLVVGTGVAVEVGAAVGRALEVDELRRSADAPRIGWVDEADGGAGDAAAPTEDDTFRAFADIDDAGEALAAGEVDSVFVVPSDFPRRHDVVRLARSWAPPSGDVGAVTDRLRRRVWPDAPPEVTAAMVRPQQRIDVDLIAPPASVAAEAEAAAGADDPSRLMLVLAVGLLLYTTIFTASSYLMQSVTTEKENRVIEVLLTSVSPLELLAGKVTGLGMLGGLQLLIWGGFGLLSLNVGAVFIAAAATIRFGPTVLMLAAAYFVFGYLFYASLMGAVGALVPSFQESGPLTFVVLLPAWLPFFVLELLMRQPNGTLGRALSLFPPTAPLVMMLRLSSGPVPAWEVALSLALLVAGAAAVLALAARVFATNQLLAGEGFNLRRGVAVLMGRT
jgi:ABC-2 type transport system permease protein